MEVSEVLDEVIIRKHCAILQRIHIHKGFSMNYFDEYFITALCYVKI